MVRTLVYGWILIMALFFLLFARIKVSFIHLIPVTICLNSWSNRFLLDCLMLFDILYLQIVRLTLDFFVLFLLLYDNLLIINRFASYMFILFVCITPIILLFSNFLFFLFTSFFLYLIADKLVQTTYNKVLLRIIINFNNAFYLRQLWKLLLSFKLLTYVLTYFGRFQRYITELRLIGFTDT